MKHECSLMGETEERTDAMDINEKLMNFLDRSPNAFWAVHNMAEELTDAGFTRLYEGAEWELGAGGSYFVTRNDSALIAFRLPKSRLRGFQMMASHADSPVFKIKTNAEIEIDKKYVKLNVEKYGGMLCAPWLDRPLSVAGRVVVETETGIESRLINIDRDLLLIPNLAIHMNRQVNDGYVYNAQTDMLPLFGSGVPKGEFLKLVAEAANAAPEQVLDTDLFLYNRMRASRFGLHGEFIGSGRLDDLQCAFASLQGLLLSEPRESAAVHIVLDNEEVGSGTKQGAAGSFLRDTLRRIQFSLGGGEEDYLRALCSSFLASADNAHAVHPNHTDKSDPTNRPYLNEGIVIKYSANQKYTTDAVSGAIFRSLCRRAGVPVQSFTNRSDMLGGSTLGNISNTQVALNTVDIGLPQLAMHSPYETAGAKDTEYLVRAAKELFSSDIEGRGDGSYRLRP